LPYLPDNERQDAIARILEHSPGPERNAFFKVFLIKNKRFAMADYQLIKDKIEEKKNWFYESSKRDLKGTTGIFDPFQLIDLITLHDLVILIKKIKEPEELSIKESYILKLYESLQELYNYSSDFKNKYSNPINYIGDFLCSNLTSDYFERFDFISKHEFMEIFTDFCADNDMNVFDISQNEVYYWDLFLSKRNQASSGIVTFLRGQEIVAEYPITLKKLNFAAEYCDWVYFVTTPFGILKIGLDKLGVFPNSNPSDINIFLLFPLKILK